MKRRALMVLSAALMGMPLMVTAQQAAPAGQAAKGRPTIEQFMKIRVPGAVNISQDGTMYVRDWPDGIFQLYRIEKPASGSAEARPGVKMTALTSAADGVAGYSLSPDGKTIVYEQSVGGNENNQIFVLDPYADGGKGKVIGSVENPKVQYATNFWTHDSSGFYFTGNEESPNDFHIYHFDIKSGKRSKILGKTGSWAANDAKHDRTRVLVGEYRSASDSSLFELNPATGELKDLGLKGEGGGTAANGDAAYMPGETAVLFLSDAEKGVRRLFLRDLATGAISKPLASLDTYEIDGISVNTDRTLLSVVTNEDGYGVLHMFRLPAFEKIELPEMEKGIVSGGNIRGNQLLYTLTNARTPGLAFQWTVPGRGEKATAPRQVSFADDQGVDLKSFRLPELVKYKSFDGLEVPAFLFLPAGAEKGKPVPFVVNYHGGPEGQFRPGFDRTVQYLVSEGFGVLQPNVRGSTGYGRAFQMMDDYKKRWDSVKDGVEAAEWLVKSGYASPGKLATYGGSYGGFMSVATLVEDGMRVSSGARKERLFGAGVNVVGIVNLKTFLEKTAGYRRKLREVEYGPLSDPEFLASVSSMTHLKEIQVPVFVAHGFNDPRVPVDEAMQLATALRDQAMAAKRMDLMPQMLVFPDEGHGFAKLDNRMLFAKQMSSFLKRTIAR